MSPTASPKENNAHTANASSKKRNSGGGGNQFGYDPTEAALRSRLPAYLPNRASDLYVHAKADRDTLIRACEQTLLKEGVCFVHAVGDACLPLAVNLAHQVKEGLHYQTDKRQLKVEIATFSQGVDLSDDYRPMPRNERRRNTAIHLKISICSSP